MDLDVSVSVESFRRLLAASWPLILDLQLQDTTGSFMDDWMQANWERIVEASIHPDLQIILEPYGEGADCNLRSSRVWPPEAKPNAIVHVMYQGNEPLVDVVDGQEIDGELVFDHFCTMADGWPVIGVPFDHVVLDRNTVTVIPARDLRYQVSVSR